MASQHLNCRILMSRNTTAPSNDRAVRVLEATPQPCSCDLVMQSRFGDAYNQEAFRHFLRVEREASARSARPFLLLLLTLTGQPSPRSRIDPGTAKRIFSNLWLCLRDTDVVGWFREGRAVGALLTEIEERPDRPVEGVIRDKVRASLSRGLPTE